MTITLQLNGKPIPKARPRMGKQGVVYDPQKKVSNKIRCQLLQQIGAKGALRRVQGACTVDMTFYTPIPNSWSHKRTMDVLGKPDVTRPALDNYAKFYCDLMNDLIYADDNQITELWCEKVYSDVPKVSIKIQELKDEEMINEHAKTVRGEVTIEDLNYMIKKANRLGLKDRSLVRVYMQEDNEGKHYYFEVEGMKNGNESNG